MSINDVFFTTVFASMIGLGIWMQWKSSRVKTESSTSRGNR